MLQPWSVSSASIAGVTRRLDCTRQELQYAKCNTTQARLVCARNEPLTALGTLRMFVCNVCIHYELFAPNFPDEAAKKNWKAWGGN